MDDLLSVLAVFQMVVYYPLIDIKFPPTASILFDTIINLASFEMIPTEKYYPLIFDLPESEAMSDGFDNFDYGTKIFLNNLGTLWLAMNQVGLQFVLYYLGRKCKKTRLGRKVQVYYKVSLFWGTPIDFLNSAYAELCFGCIMNWYSLTWRGNTHAYGMVINNIYLFISSVLVVGYPVWKFVFLYSNYYSL